MPPKLLKGRSKEKCRLWLGGGWRSCTPPVLLFTPHPADSKAGHKVQVKHFLSPFGINYGIF